MRVELRAEHFASLPVSLAYFFLVIRYSYLYVLKLGLVVHFTFNLNLSERCQELVILRCYGRSCS